jgi:hypothetical protein
MAALTAGSTSAIVRHAWHGGRWEVSGNDEDEDEVDSSDREQQDRCEVHRQGWLCGSVEIVESPLLALDVRSIEKPGRKGGDAE